MNDKKTKKVRAFLINFVNEELNKQKRNKKYDILINSIPLDILAKKNMQCKVFVIEENNFFYQQNADIGWMMGVNYDINNSNYGKSCINLFTNRMSKQIDKLDSSNRGEEKIEIINKETIIKKNLDSVLYIRQEKDIGSPLGISLFQKKEISEKKFIKENSGAHFPSTISNLFINKSEREKGKEKDESKLRDNNSLKDDFFLMKKYSNITLETELSRIIKCCHDEDCPSSQEHCVSESRRSELNKELKIAKMYAKRLNLYCKKLKNKIDKKYNKDEDNNDDVKNDNNNNIKNNIIRKDHIKPKTYNENINVKKNNTDKTKNKSHKLNKIKYTKIKPKRHNKGEEKEHFSKFKRIEKSKTFKFNNTSSHRNKFLEHSSKIKGNTTSRENTILIRKSILKLNNSKKRNSLTIKMDKMKQVYFKSPKKGEHLKSEKCRKQTSKEYRKINIHENQISNNNNQVSDEHNKKLIKKKKTLQYKPNEKTSLFRISKMKTIKRSSIDDNMNHTGLEQINFFKIKTKSSQDLCPIKAFKKKSPKKKEKPSIINNNINNNSTSISQRKDTSDSSEFIPQEDYKKLKYKYTKKNSANFMKGKKENFEGKENLKKFKKRKTTEYDEIKIQKLKKISPVKHARDKRTHTTEKNKHKFGRHEFNNNEVEVTDFDDFNVIDEFLYKRKLKRSKNNNGTGMN
jgi:hypothetical protein